MTRLPRSIRSRRPGLTLVELLIVCLIIVLFIAVAAPLMRPNTADTKVREAARQLNAYFAEAKAFAAQRGRAVALVFDRSAAQGEAARDPNIVTRLYLAEAPPHYSGDDLGSWVAAHDGLTAPPWGTQQNPAPNYSPIARDPRPSPNQALFNVTQLQWPPWYTSISAPSTNTVPLSGNVFETFPAEIPYAGQPNRAKASWYKLDFNGATMLNVIMATYLPTNAGLRFAPFRIKFGGRGSYHDAYVQFDSNNGTYNYFCWMPFGQRPPNRACPFQIEFPPVPASDSVLEMPSGTVVDLQFSGLGVNSNAFYSTATQPLMIVFSPGGDVERIYANGTFSNQVTRMHFLVGTLDRAVDAVVDLPSVSSLAELQTFNLGDPINQWVSVHARTGHVATADNVPPSSYAPGNGLTALQNSIAQARALALTLDTKGGR